MTDQEVHITWDQVGDFYWSGLTVNAAVMSIHRMGFGLSGFYAVSA